MQGFPPSTWGGRCPVERRLQVLAGGRRLLFFCTWGCGNIVTPPPKPSLSLKPTFHWVLCIPYLLNPSNLVARKKGLTFCIWLLPLSQYFLSCMIISFLSPSYIVFPFDCINPSVLINGSLQYYLYTDDSLLQLIHYRVFFGGCYICACSFPVILIYDFYVAVHWGFRMMAHNLRRTQWTPRNCTATKNQSQHLSQTTRHKVQVLDLRAIIICDDMPTPQ